MTSLDLLRSKLRNAPGQLSNLARGLRLAWDAAGLWTTVWLTLLLAQGLLPGVLIYLTKLIVNSVAGSFASGGSSVYARHVLILVVLFGAVMIAIEILRTATSWVRAVQAELLQDHIFQLIHEKSVTADLAFYEFPDFYDHLHRARSEATYRPVALLENLGTLLQNGITLLTMGVILIPLGPWLAVALLVSTLPAFWVVLHYSLAQYRWRQRVTADERRTWYYDWLMTAAEVAAELRLFGLGGYFQNAFTSLRHRLRNEKLSLARRQSVAELSASIVALAVTGLALGYMVWRALHGEVTLGDLALIYAAFMQGQRLIRLLLESVGQMYANSLFLGNLFEFLALQSAVLDPPNKNARSLSTVKNEIRFAGVTFSYPESARLTLENFSLKIRAGQITALVGPNGAGKSTLIKLLCRFYDPQQGSIQLDGIDVRELPARQLRRLVTVLFQEPVHYNATVAENISYGDLENQPSREEIVAAVRAAGVEEIVGRLSEGYESLLGKWFVGGTELSVGEWQRVALARAFLRRAPIIILDEPTSALDSWAEADWLMRFRQLAVGRTSLVITHRFTTAMQADVIHVMDNGQIVESGTHLELMNRHGLYAASWLQQMAAADDAQQRNGLAVAK